MKLVDVLDNDAMRPTSIEDKAAVYTTESPSLSREEIVMKFPEVFAEGNGLIEGEYNVKLGPAAIPVQHAPRRVQVTIREKVKESLDDLVKKIVIAEVT